MMERYSSLDGLRSIAAFGIVLMHINVNGAYFTNGTVASIINSFGDFVFLFMVISAFSISNGYYKRIINNQTSIFDFYKKRIIKIWPVLFVLVLVDLVVSFTESSLYEAFANLTLLFGFLPNNDLSVIGVAWEIGVLFIFYFMYPFFCFLMKEKKRIWISFFVFTLFTCLCSNYFGLRKNDFIFDIPFFIVGCLLFLYKDKLRPVWNVAFTIIALFLYIVLNKNIVTKLLLSSSILSLSICFPNSKVLSNRIMKFISRNSLEIYLSHMAFYRLLEKLNMLHPFKSNIISFIFVNVSVLMCCIVFSILFNRVLNLLKKGIDIS